MVEMAPTPWDWVASWWSWWYLVLWIVAGALTAFGMRLYDQTLDDEPAIIGLFIAIWPIVLCCAVVVSIAKGLDAVARAIEKWRDEVRKRQWEMRHRTGGK